MSETFAAFSGLSGFQIIGQGFRARCPVHADGQERTPSFRGTVKGNKIVVRCHSCGASGREVKDALGLSWSAFFTDSRSRGRVDARKQRLEVLEREKLAIWREKELIWVAQQLRVRDMLIRTARKWRAMAAAYRGYSYLEYKFELLRTGSTEEVRSLFAIENRISVG